MYRKFGYYFKIDNNDTVTRRTSDVPTAPKGSPFVEKSASAPEAEVQSVCDVYADCLIRHRRLSAELARRHYSKNN